MRGEWTKIEVPHNVRLPYGFYLHFKDRVALAENYIMEKTKLKSCHYN